VYSAPVPDSPPSRPGRVLVLLRIAAVHGEHVPEIRLDAKLPVFADVLPNPVEPPARRSSTSPGGPGPGIVERKTRETERDPVHAREAGPAHDRVAGADVPAVRESTFTRNVSFDSLSRTGSPSGSARLPLRPHRKAVLVVVDRSAPKRASTRTFWGHPGIAMHVEADVRYCVYPIPYRCREVLKRGKTESSFCK